MGIRKCILGKTFVPLKKDFTAKTKYHEYNTCASVTSLNFFLATLFKSDINHIEMLLGTDFAYKAVCLIYTPITYLLHNWCSIQDYNGMIQEC